MRPVYEVKFNLRGGEFGASYNRLYPEVLPEKKTGKLTDEVNEREQKIFHSSI